MPKVRALVRFTDLDDEFAYFVLPAYNIHHRVPRKDLPPSVEAKLIPAVRCHVKVDLIDGEELKLTDWEEK